LADRESATEEAFLAAGVVGVVTGGTGVVTGGSTGGSTGGAATPVTPSEVVVTGSKVTVSSWLAST
jgi:hypothetical protein